MSAGSVNASGLHFDNLTNGEVAGCAIMLDTLRYLPQGDGGGGNLMYLLGFSAQTSVAKAVWANLIPPHFSYLNVDDTLYMLADGGKGWEVRTSRISHGIDELVLFPPCAGRWGTVGEMLVVERQGIRPAETLMRFLEYRSTVPQDSGWADEMWSWAIETGATVELAGFGPRAWLVRLSDDLLLGSLTRFAATTRELSLPVTNTSD
ncbi:MAG: hypothetical protein ACYDAG_16685 [Chloroflexota bacterium]